MLTKEESATLREFIRISTESKHVELESKMQFPIDRSLMSRLIARVKRRHTHSTSDVHLTITTPEGQRITVQSQQLVNKFVVQGTLEGIEHTVMEKRPYLEQMQKDTGSRDAPIATDTIMLTDAEVKITLRSELPFQRKFTTVPPKSHVRLIQRYSHSANDCPFRWDFSVVRSGEIRTNAKDDMPMIIRRLPNFEAELEFVPADVQNPLDSSKEFENCLIPVLQIWQDSDFILPRTVRQKYVEQFKALNLPFVDAVTFTLSHLDAGSADSVLKGYTVTEKADGIRNMLYVTDDKRVVRIGKNLELSWTGMSVKNSRDVGTVVDGEFLAKLHTFKIFDCLRWRGKNVLKLPLWDEDDKDTSSYRLGLCQEFVNNVDRVVELGYRTMAIEAKVFHYAEGAELFTACRTILERTYPYEIDGLIFTPAHLGLGEGMKGNRWNKLLKWKPPHMNTVDFNVQRPPKNEVQEGIQNGKRWKMGHLYVGSNGDQYVFPALQLTGEYSAPVASFAGAKYINIPFVPSRPSGPNAYQCKLFLDEDGQAYTQNPRQRIDFGAIVEFSYDTETLNWIPLRLREDKKNGFGNNYRTAQGVWESIHAPVTEDMIKNGLGQTDGQSEATNGGYYKESERKTYGLKLFHGAVKSQLYQKYLHTASDLLELACGRAGDKNRWNCRRVVGIDNSQEGLENTFDGAAVRILQDIDRGRSVPPVLFVHADVGKNLMEWDAGLSDRSQEYIRLLADMPVLIRTTPYLDRFKGLFRTGFDCISIQFAIHYFWQTEESIQLFLDNIKNLSKPGTVFMGTVLDGASTYGELAANETLQVYDGEGKQLLAQLKRQFDPLSQPWPSLGLPIDVFYESFSEAQREFLVPFDDMVKRMNSIDFELVESSLFKDIHIPEQSKVPSEQARLSFLHRNFVFKRNEPVPEPVAPKPKRVVKKKERPLESEPERPLESDKEQSEPERPLESDKEQSEPERPLESEPELPKPKAKRISKKKADEATDKEGANATDKEGALASEAKPKAKRVLKKKESSA